MKANKRSAARSTPAIPQNRKRSFLKLDDLVWDCCERLRRGEQVRIDDYLVQCKSEQDREEFQMQISTAALLDASITLQVGRLWQEVKADAMAAPCLKMNRRKQDLNGE